MCRLTLKCILKLGTTYIVCACVRKCATNVTLRYWNAGISLIRADITIYHLLYMHSITHQKDDANVGQYEAELEGESLL